MATYSFTFDPAGFDDGAYTLEIITVDNSVAENETDTTPINFTIRNSGSRPAGSVDGPPGVGRPAIVVQCAFGQAPFTVSPEWTDITADVLMEPGISTVCGATADNPTPTAGSLTLTLKDQDRRYDPENADSPYAGGLTYGCPLRVLGHYESALQALVNAGPLVSGRPLVGGGTSDVALAYGYVDGFPQKYASQADNLDLIDISAPDALSVLARTSFTPAHPFTSAPPAPPDAHALVSGEPLVRGGPLVGPNGYPDWMCVNTGAIVTGSPTYNPQERSGDRIRILCELAGIPDDFLDIDGGQTVVEGGTPTESNLLDHFRTIALTEDGRLFQAPNGKITFRERRPAQAETNTPQALFCEAGGFGVPYSDIEFDPADRRFLVNRCVRSSNTVGDVIEQDDASIAKYGVFEDSQQLAFAFREDAEGQAIDKVFRHAEPPARINSLTIKPDRAPDVMFPVDVMARIGNRYVVTRTPLRTGDPIVKTVIAEQITRTFNTKTWTTRIDLSEADLTNYFTLGVTDLEDVNAGNIVPY